MDIDATNWQTLQTLFHLVVACPGSERDRMLDEVCEDPNLRRRVLDIVLAAEAVSEPVSRAGADVNGSIGPYRLIRHLGTGGLGSVYLAERLVSGTALRFALKILAPHAAGPRFVERFHREQHILASLESPHITRMLDAGLSDTGQPYLVMEYVQGASLDAYCDARHLNIRARIEMFLQVCDAVAYAHRSLVVHLDLKPSNILVTDDGVVKLLDFGTSRFIEPENLATMTIMATPAYASPEQLRSEPVTTACDVYSLGVILFELLCGARPGGRASTAVMIERAVREQEPGQLDHEATDEAASWQQTTLVRLRAQLKGDLATIASKCLRSRSKERYVSVDALADDLRRYLAGRPVQAGPKTIWYRAKKFVRRHGLAVAASAAAGVALAASLTYAEMRQREALREARRSVEMQAFLSRLFKLANTHYLGKPAATVSEFLRFGSVVLPQMIKTPADQRAGELSLAESMFYNSDYKDAEDILKRVIADAKSSGDLPTEAEAEGFGGMIAYKLGDLKAFEELSAHAVQLSDKQGVSPEMRVLIKCFRTQNRWELGYATPADIALQRAALNEAHAPGVSQDTLAYAMLDLAVLQSQTSSLPDSLKLAHEGEAIFQAEPYAVCERGGAAMAMGFLQRQSLDLQGSLESFRVSNDAIRTCKGDGSRDALIAASNLGIAFALANRPKEAVAVLEPTLAGMRTAIGADNLALMGPLQGLAIAYLSTQQFPESEEMCEHLFQLTSGKISPSSGRMGLIQLTWAQALAGEGRLAEALAHAEMAERAYAAGPRLPMTIAYGQRAHRLALDLQSKMNAGLVHESKP